VSAFLHLLRLAIALPFFLVGGILVGIGYLLWNLRPMPEAWQKRWDDWSSRNVRTDLLPKPKDPLSTP
jgi:hypothetical protein